MMDKITAPELPEQHQRFIDSVVAAAKENGMNEFEITYRPHWETPDISHCYGDIKVCYCGTDGRGRPDHRVSVEFNATYKL